MITLRESGQAHLARLAAMAQQEAGDWRGLEDVPYPAAEERCP
jgi:hypothetical protein